MRKFTTDFGVERMVQVTGTNTYTVSSGIKAFPAGLSGIGRLVSGGTGLTPADQDGWPYHGTKRQRTAVGWTGNRRDFFLIVARDRAGAGNVGWTWQETVDFFLTGLPAYMQEQKKVTISIANAMMLDGGGSTSFKYWWRDKNGNTVRVSPDLRTSRKIPTIVTTWGLSPR